MKEKKQKLDYFSENLAFPEIHVNSVKPQNDDDSDQDETESDVVFENLAVPEVKVNKKKK